MRRVGSLAGMVFLALIGAGNASGAAERRPNVVIIVTDDHGYGDVGYHNPTIRTPNLDRLAAEGVRLERFYVYPTCSLTRAALLTGLSTLRTGVNNRNGLALEYVTMPERFREEGYQTLMFGKWHLGGAPDNSLSGPDYYPMKQGFDHFHGFLHGAIDYERHIRRDTGERDWQRDGEPLNEEGFTTDLLADSAVRALSQRDRSRPVFLYLAFNGVHGPLQIPPGGVGAYAKEPSRKRQVLAANVTYMDEAIGRVLKAIDQEGMREDTIVLFHGDNGGQLSQGASNAPLRGEKGQVFEGGIRVPAIVRWPGVLKAGRQSAQLFWVADVFPTIASAASVDTQGLSFDGRSLWNELRDGRSSSRTLLHGTTDLAYFEGPWKLIRPGGNGEPMLFRIVDDPNETKDVARDEPEVVRELSGKLETELKAFPRGKPGRGGERGMKKQGGGMKGRRKGARGAP